MNKVIAFIILLIPTIMFYHLGGLKSGLMFGISSVIIFGFMLNNSQENRA